MRPAIVPWRCRCSGSCVRRSGGRGAEQPLDSGSCSAQVLGGVGVCESSASREQQLVMLAELDLATSAARTTACLQRASTTELCREARLAKTLRGDADLDGVPGGAADCPVLEIDRKIVLDEAPLHDLALRHRGEHLHIALGQLGADRPVAIGGIAEYPAWPAPWWLGIDQVLGLRPVALTPSTDVHGGDQRLAAACRCSRAGGRRAGDRCMSAELVATEQACRG